MGAECGVTTSVFPSDEMTRSFLHSQQRKSDYMELTADKNAIYTRVVDIDLSKTIIEQVKNDYNDSDYWTVIETLKEKMLQLSEQVKPEAYKYLALSYAAIGDMAVARKHFKTALAMDPKLSIDAEIKSPDVENLLMSVKKKWHARGNLLLLFIPRFDPLIGEVLLMLSLRIKNREMLRWGQGVFHLRIDQHFAGGRIYLG
jgi:tetratricopeptide (TPR) repeat protein